MDTTGVIQIIILLLLLILSGFFSSAETAMTCTNVLRIRALAEDEEGNPTDRKRARRVQHIHEKYSKMLSTILIGNNIVNIAASSLTTTFTIRVLGSYMVGVTTGILTFVVLIVGEIVPKNWASSHAEKIALAYSGAIHFLMTILTPVIWIVDHLSNGIIHLFHLEADSDAESITETELRTYVDASHEEGVIETEEHDMINNLFDFSDAYAEEVMIPRIDMETVSIDDTFDEIRKTFEQSMYTRLPVYEEDPDNIVGMIHIKDFLFIEDSADFHVQNIMRDVFYTYERKKTADLLIEMRNKAVSLAIVLNEYGTAVGMLTMEDLLEEIVGEIRDEYDTDEEELIRKLSNHAYLIQAGMKLDDINDALDLTLESEDYDSIGGMMIAQLDRLPEQNETVTLDNGIVLQAKGIDQNRIRKVLLKLPK